MKKALQVENLESILSNLESSESVGAIPLNGKASPEKLPSQKPTRKVAKIALPKIGQEFSYMEDNKVKKCFMEEQFSTLCELPENAHIQNIVGYKVEVQRKNRKSGELETKKVQVNKYTIEGLPANAFYETCEYIEEYYDSEKQKIVSGKKYKYTPVAKDKQILASVTNKDGKEIKNLVYQF